jgi:oxygen-independent coproporphyrinogen-3 oxidase
MESNQSKINIKSSNIINNNKLRDLGIYIHIPFCVKKCNYCDFLSAPATGSIINEYMKALITEIGVFSRETNDYTVPTIFIGGGTPSIVEASDIIRIMEQVGRVFHVDYGRLEATIEVNPGTVTREKLQNYRKAGINRLSFGLQSTDNMELKQLGRIHTYEKFIENYNTARELGYNNINIDLMSALPGQTLDSWEQTLIKTVTLQPEHISAYSLIIEEGTPFYDLYNETGPAFNELPDEDTDRSMYHLTKQFLGGSGYYRYEISNYAKPGYESRHNSSYWTGTEYLGFGLGASSLIEGVRFNNLRDLREYISKSNELEADIASYNIGKNKMIYKNKLLSDPSGLRENYTELSLRQRMEEFMFLGLRMQVGISKSEFLKRFNTDINSVYGDIILKHNKSGLLSVSGDRIYLTEYGTDVSNYVLSDYILD